MLLSIAWSPLWQYSLWSRTLRSCFTHFQLKSLFRSTSASSHPFPPSDPPFLYTVHSLSSYSIWCGICLLARSGRCCSKIATSHRSQTASITSSLTAWKFPLPSGPCTRQGLLTFVWCILESTPGVFHRSGFRYFYLSHVESHRTQLLQLYWRRRPHLPPTFLVDFFIY